MLPNIQFAAATSLLLLFSGVKSLDTSYEINVLEDESPDNSTALAKRSEDCDFAAWQWADVDCNYKWDGKQLLDYYIMITPTGQAPVQGWAKGIVDNIYGDCGAKRDQISPVEEVRGWERRKLHHPKTHEIREVDGLFARFTYLWPWTPGDDSRGCIESAIRKGSCYGGISFKNGGCYKV